MILDTCYTVLKRMQEDILPAMRSEEDAKKRHRYIKSCLLQVMWVANSRQQLPAQLKASMDQDLALSRNAVAHQAVGYIFDAPNEFYAYLEDICKKYIGLIEQVKRDPEAPLVYETYGYVAHQDPSAGGWLRYQLLNTLDTFLTDKINHPNDFSVYDKAAVIYDLFSIRESVPSAMTVPQLTQSESQCYKRLTVFRQRVAHMTLEVTLDEKIEDVFSKAFELVQHASFLHLMTKLHACLTPTPVTEPEKDDLSISPVEVRSKQAAIDVEALRAQFLQTEKNFATAVANFDGLKTKGLINEDIHTLLQNLLRLTYFESFLRGYEVILSKVRPSKSEKNGVETLSHEIDSLAHAINWIVKAASMPDALETLTVEDLKAGGKHCAMSLVAALVLVVPSELYGRTVAKVSPKKNDLSRLLEIYLYIGTFDIDINRLDQNMIHLVGVCDQTWFSPNDVFDQMLKCLVSATLLKYFLQTYPIDRNSIVSDIDSNHKISPRIFWIVRCANLSRDVSLVEMFADETCDINQPQILYRPEGILRSTLFTCVAGGEDVVTMHDSDLNVYHTAQMFIAEDMLAFLLRHPGVRLNNPEDLNNSGLAQLVHTLHELLISDQANVFAVTKQVEKLKLLLLDARIDLNIHLDIYQPLSIKNPNKQQKLNAPLLFFMLAFMPEAFIEIFITVAKTRGYSCYHSLLSALINQNFIGQLKSVVYRTETIDAVQRKCFFPNPAIETLSSEERFERLHMILSHAPYSIAHTASAFFMMLKSDYLEMEQIERKCDRLRQLTLALVTLTDQDKKEKMHQSIHEQMQSLESQKTRICTTTTVIPTTNVRLSVPSPQGL